jgi:hypothetical protein
MPPGTCANRDASEARLSRAFEGWLSVQDEEGTTIWRQELVLDGVDHGAHSWMKSRTSTARRKIC